MRCVTKKFRPQPAALKKCIDKYKEELLSGNGTIKNKCYQKAKKRLDKLYFGKCAYCESNFQSTSYLQIDHYRPKDHYWWLVFEWSNLMPSCAACNNKKRNEFPIQNKNRVGKPSRNTREWIVNSKILMAEEPLLLNPEVDNPNEHIVYLPDGGIEEKAGSKKGEATIRVCGLDRQHLIAEYRGQIDRVFAAIEGSTNKLLALIQQDQKLVESNKLYWYSVFYLKEFQELRRLQEPQNRTAFTQLAFYMYVDFEEFIIARLPVNDGVKAVVREAFTFFREGKLK